MNIDELKYAIMNLLHRKTRSFLTALSIFVGIMAISALVSFGIGIQYYMDAISEEVGTDKIFIQSRSMGAPGTDETFSLSKTDVEFVSKIRGVEEILGWYFKPVEVSYKGQKKYNYANGYDIGKTWLLEETLAVDILKGRPLKEGDLDKIVLGYAYTLPDRVFKDALQIGDKLEVNDKAYQIVGFYEEIGNPQDDANVYFTDEAYELLYPESKDKFGFILIKTEKQVDPEDVASDIREKLRKHLGQKKGEQTFFVQTFADALQTFSIVLNVINGVLVLIALISVIVASVNIMNTMYTAVLERTKEIGIMKAIGAKNKDIFFIFVFEAGLISLIGGALGMLLGYSIAYLGGVIASASGFDLLKPAFPWWLSVACLVFSFVIGAFAGFLPAMQAAKQKPVDALRYE